MPTRRTPANTRITEPSAAEQAAMELATVQPIPAPQVDPLSLMQTEEDWRDPSPAPVPDLVTHDHIIDTGDAYDWGSDQRTAELFTLEAVALREGLRSGPQPDTVEAYVLTAVTAATAIATERGDLTRTVAYWAVEGIQRLNTNAAALDQIAADHRASVGQ